MFQSTARDSAGGVAASRRRAAGVAECLVIAGLVSACGGNSGANQPPPGGLPPVPVELEVLSPAPIEDASEYVATLRSVSSTTIHPEVAGYITEIFVTSGDQVRAGTPLMQIDPRRQEASVSSQTAAIARQEAAVKYARDELDRAGKLLEAGIVSKQVFDQAETNHATAEAELRELRAQLEEQSVDLQYFRVAAPTSGIVGDIPVRVGMRVGPETELTSIDRNDALEVLVQVPVERAPQLELGLPMQLTDSSGRVAGTTKVSFISPRVDDRTQMVLVKGQIGAGAGLRSLQLVRARIIWRTLEGLVVPVLSVLRIGTERFVFVAEEQDGRLVARQRRVELGPIVGDAFVVRSGVEPQERLVVSGIQRLADGAPIAAR